MYNIKQAALRAGVSVPVLRQWERRYGVIQPGRTASGYRTYDDAAIARVRAMRALVDDGWAPSAAAASLREQDDQAIQAVLERAQPAATSGGHRPDFGPGADPVATFLASATALDAAGMEAALDEMFVRGSFELVMERYVFPALRAVGEAWVDGRADVAAEHAASHSVLRRLGTAYQSAGRSAPGQRPVLVGLPPGARHELGALSFSITARRSGLPVLYLGADLPVGDWVDAVLQTDARAAVVGVMVAADVEPAASVAAAVEAVRPDALVAFGGPAAGAVPSGARRLMLPDGLTAEVDALVSALQGPEPRSAARAPHRGSA
jgi:MerR family transcriptional regulator, light-induced transcriptional regulator